MADNLTVRTTTGDQVVATDDIGGVHYTRMKLIMGADGVNDGDISVANPLPLKAVDYSFGTEQSGSATTATAVGLFDGVGGHPTRDADSRRLRLCNCSLDYGLIVRYGAAPTTSVFIEYLTPLETRDLDCSEGTIPYILGYGGTVTYVAQELS